MLYDHKCGARVVDRDTSWTLCSSKPAPTSIEPEFVISSILDASVVSSRRVGLIRFRKAIDRIVPLLRYRYSTVVYQKVGSIV